MIAIIGILVIVIVIVNVVIVNVVIVIIVAVISQNQVPGVIAYWSMNECPPQN